MILYRVVLTQDDGLLGVVVVLQCDSITSSLTINCLNANYRETRNLFFLVSKVAEYQIIL